MVHFIILAIVVLLVPWHILHDYLFMGAICAGWMLAYYLTVHGAEWLVSMSFPDGAVKSLLLKKWGGH